MIALGAGLRPAVGPAVRSAARAPPRRAGPAARARRPPIAASSTAPSSQPAVGDETASGAVLQLDYYRLLRVAGGSSREALARALEKALTNPPALGYSQQCLLSRGQVLKRTVETLLDPQARRAYDEALLAGSITEAVPDDFVPGVLALLLEAGDAHTVVAAGEEWLSTHRRDPRSRDVALSTALAHRAVAAELMKKQGDAVNAASMLEVAVDLLRRYRAAPGLQAEVAGALAELQPALACQLVALPLERFKERERGVQVAIQVLTDTSGAKKGMSKQQFLDRLAESLTAAEQVEVYGAAGSRFAELPSELYDMALAHIAEAVSLSEPVLLEKALAALAAAAAAAPPAAPEQASDSGVRQLAERRAIDERHRRQVAYAVSQLLLGEAQSAVDALGLRPGASEASKCERSVLAFIKANSPDQADPLPGLCVLAQRWVSDVALASFRGAAGTSFSLDAWFEDDGVRRYLARRHVGPAPAGPLQSTTRLVGSWVATPVVEGLAGMLALVGLLDDGLALEEEEEGTASSSHAAGTAGGAFAAPLQQPQARPAAAEAAADDPHPARRSPEDLSQVDMRASRQERPKAVKPQDLRPRHTARPDLTANAGVAPASAPAAGPAPAAVEEALAGEEVDANAVFAMQPIEQLTPLDGEERMWDAQGSASVRWGRLAATVVLLASGGFLLGRGMLLRGTQAGNAQRLATAAAATPAAAPQQSPSLSRQEAAGVVAEWQAVKAAALGPQHDIQGLSTILRGEVLQQWQERAQQIEQKGWHYLHTLEGSQINGVTVDAESGVAHVSATFREAVIAHRGSDDNVQAFRSEYSVDYELEREGSGWVITAATVRG